MIFQSKWYCYPRYIQQCVLMMMRTKEAFHITADGMIRCNLVNFLNVNRNIQINIQILFDQKSADCMTAERRCFLQFQVQKSIYSAFMVSYEASNRNVW